MAQRILPILKRKWMMLAVLVDVLVCLTFAGFWQLGSQLCAPCNRVVGSLPSTLRGGNVEFRSGSGSTLHGWYLPGVKHHGAVILMHGVRGDRTNMLNRAEFLNRAGYAILLFDFQAHGESSGQHITFGRLESEDAKAAVAFVRSKLPGEKIAVLGASLGGAAAQRRCLPSRH